MKIILIDDDEELLELLRDYLEENSIEVKTALSGEEGLGMIEKEKFDLIILDVMMPGMGGLETLKRINSDYPGLPVIMLTAKSEEIDRVVGLELGADDYIVKPFSSRELLARIKAIKRREEKFKGKSEALPEDSLPLKLDYKKRYVIVRGEEIELSAIEFDILDIMLQNRGMVLSRERIMDLTRGKTYMSYDRSIDVNISRLRQKIEKDHQNPEFIKTVWGVGYIFTGE